MGFVTQGNNPKRYTPGIKTWYGYSYTDVPTEYSEFLEVITSNKKFEDIISIAGMGYCTLKPEGTAFSYDSITQGVATRFIPVIYGTGVMFTHEALRDDLYNPTLAKIAGQAMSLSARQSREILGANLLNNCIVTNLADGQPLLSTAHTLAKGGTYSNTLATAADLSEASIETLLVQMMTAQNDAGLTINVKARKLIVGPNDAFNQRRILGSAKRVGTANNDISVINNDGLIPEGCAVNRFLTLNAGWFITTDIQGNGTGMLMVNRESDDISSTDDFDTMGMKSKVYFSTVVSAADTRCVFGSVGA